MPRRRARAFDGRAAYTALHGVPPSRVLPLPTRRAPRVLVDLGPVTAVEYDKRVPGGREEYRHEFGKGARPALARDETGRLHFVGGYYTTTDHGIEDTAGAAATAHRRGNPVRYNPEAQMRTLWTGVKVLLVAFSFAILSYVIMARVTRLQAKTKGIAAGVIGVLGGVLIAKKWPSAGIGLIVGGGVVALETLGVDAWVEARLTPRPAAGAGTTGGGASSTGVSGQLGSGARLEQLRRDRARATA